VSLRKSLATIICCSLPLGAACLHRAEAGVPKKDLIGYWMGNGNALDSSMTGNNGSFSGSYAPGTRCHHFAFDLSTGQVTIPDIPAYSFYNYSGWTVGFWFNADPANIGTTNGFFLGQDDGSGFQNKWLIEYGYSVYQSGSTNSFVLHLNDPQQLRLFLQSETVPFPSGWNQLTVVWVKAQGTVSFYLNGQPIGTDSYTGTIPDPSADLIFGYAEPGLTYTGLLDNIVIYSRALTPTQVQNLAKPPHMCFP